MNARHTSGPWAWAESGDTGGENPVQVYEVLAGDYVRVAENIADGDAQLIAAAPDLLVALEAFLRAPSVGSAGPGSATIVVQDFNLRAARNALAKAKGES